MSVAYVCRADCRARARDAANCMAAGAIVAGRHQLGPVRSGRLPVCVVRRRSVPVALRLLPHVSGLDGNPAGLATRYGDRTDTLARLRRALAAAATGRANLAVITGDLTDHGTLAEFQLFTEVIVAAPLPVEVLPGNHDHCGHRYERDRDDAPRGGGSLAARR